MNTIDKARDELIKFIQSDKKIALFTGTNQNKKHILALSLIFNHYSNSNLLFRANSVDNLSIFLSPIFSGDLSKYIKNREIPLNNGSSTLYLDTINKRTWSSSPHSVDVSIFYPIDSVKAEDGTECVNNLIKLTKSKIFLISWTDNEDFSWTNQYNPIRIIYDAEEERPEYHQEIKNIIEQSKNTQKFKETTPSYAQSTEENYQITIFCRKCQKNRKAKLNKPFPGLNIIKSANHGEYEATCLFCGNTCTDNYNWRL